MRGHGLLFDHGLYACVLLVRLELKSKSPSLRAALTRRWHVEKWPHLVYRQRLTGSATSCDTMNETNEAHPCVIFPGMCCTVFPGSGVDLQGWNTVVWSLKLALRARETMVNNCHPLHGDVQVADREGAGPPHTHTERERERERERESFITNYP